MGGPQEELAKINQVIHELESASIVHLIEELPTLIQGALAAVDGPPAGDPDALDRAARAYTTAGSAISSIAGKVRTHATDNIPKAWTGYAGETASNAIGDVADDLDATDPAFSQASTALTTLASAVRQAKKDHADGVQKLKDAAADVAMGITLDIGKLKKAKDEAIAGLQLCAKGYQKARDSSATAVRAFGDVASLARLAEVELSGRFSPVDAAVLADQLSGAGHWDRGVLSGDQLRRASEALAKLSPADAAALRKMLLSAQSDTERAYLLKALAAGHTPAELSVLATAIRGKSDTWLSEHLSLGTDDSDASPYGDPLSVDGTTVDQVDDTTCGSASLLMVRARSDPMYALYLTTGQRPDGSVTGGTFESRFNDEQHRIKSVTTVGWPGALGTPPWGASGMLNSDGYTKATGHHYETQWVGSNDNGTLDDITSAVDKGEPVVLYTGNTWSPRHVVTVVGHDGGNLQIYEPSSGSMYTVSENDFLHGKMGAGAGGWPKGWFALVPKD